ncbi:MAG: hypothetical protein AB2693_28040 [Candidatus Thiodiazotropha sp.]
MEEATEEPDWDHDPVDIHLFTSEEEENITDSLEPSWAGVSFASRERLSDSSDDDDLRIKIQQ